MREIVHIQAGQCGNQIGAKVGIKNMLLLSIMCLHLIASRAGRRVHRKWTAI